MKSKSLYLNRSVNQTRKCVNVQDFLGGKIMKFNPQEMEKEVRR